MRQEIMRKRINDQRLCSQAIVPVSRMVIMMMVIMLVPLSGMVIMASVKLSGELIPEIHQI